MVTKYIIIYLIKRFMFHIIVVTIFIDDATFTRQGKSYRRVLLRNSYRVNGQVRHDTLANLSHCSNEEIQALKLALKHKGQLTQLGVLSEEARTQ